MKPFTVDDLFEQKKITDLHGLAGHSIAYGTVRSVDRQANEYLTHIWEFNVLDKKAAPVQNGDSSDNSPRLSPDGMTLAFLSSRGGAQPQLYLLPLGGGEPRQLGNFPKGVTSVRWAPTSRELFVGVPLSVDPDLRGQRGTSESPEGGSDAEVCWKLPYKMDGTGYLLGREIHIFCINADTGEARQVTDGPFEVFSFDISQDGERLVYSRSREGRYAHLTDLWLCDLESAQHRRMTFNHASAMQPSWSPDGKWIAFSGATREGDGETRLWLLNVDTGDVSLGEDHLEIAHPEALLWDKSGERLFAGRAWRGRHEIIAVAIPRGTVQVLATGDRQLGALSAVADGFALSVQSPAEAEELFYKNNDSDDLAKVSSLNAWWENRTPIEFTSRSFEVPDGKGGKENIEGWLLRSKDLPKGTPTPLLDDIHGGPASYALLDYDTNVYWQALCAQGWTVLLLNAVGSSSFGGEFCSRLSGKWGELDFPQHLAAIEQLQAEGICDARVCITGKSYGGYLSSWAIGHTEMFKAAVVMAPVGNIETHYGTSDGGYCADPLYIGTAPEFQRSRARELSPLQYVEKAKTATLFLQGKDDERCPKCQSEELFVSLYRTDKTHTELVLYPGEGHLFLSEGKPRNRADASQRIIDWHNSHIGVNQNPGST